MGQVLYGLHSLAVAVNRDRLGLAADDDGGFTTVAPPAWRHLDAATMQVCILNISVYIQSMFSQCSV